MEVLFKDDKYVAETVEILSALMKDADHHGEKNVHVHSITTQPKIYSMLPGSTIPTDCNCIVMITAMVSITVSALVPLVCLT